MISVFALFVQTERVSEKPCFFYIFQDLFFVSFSVINRATFIVKLIVTCHFKRDRMSLEILKGVCKVNHGIESGLYANVCSGLPKA